MLVLNYASRHYNVLVSGVQLPAFLTSVLDVCGQFHATTALNPLKESPIPVAQVAACVHKVGLNAAALVYRAEENFLPLLRIESGFLGVQPVV
jgi:hypothetical protein